MAQDAVCKKMFHEGQTINIHGLLFNVARITKSGMAIRRVKPNPPPPITLPVAGHTLGDVRVGDTLP